MFWYHEDLERLEREIASSLEEDPKMVFYGSSSFTLWNDLTEIFKEYKPINLGFGGSTLGACTWFFDRVFENIKKPEAIVVYAGDNDLGDNRHPEEVVLFFENLLAKIREKYGNIPCTYISIKPSISRWYLSDSIRYTNSNIKELCLKDENFHFVNIYEDMLDANGYPDGKYFVEDGLHLSKKGYRLWAQKMKEKKEIFPEKIKVKM
ncbi:GDSL-type esterase/lipase family protein [Flavicella sp.]|uniref:GDSL-type esterase/lipase family protein n=1 Tax=Flavicella sp. TaxID=2957742 RepID=UPI0026174E10|nr:GDSL-type esterase/lipase family protein [Flavicella sp.]MDG1804266.1 GDSL-type esterase/lipase family protein [Flavicella sp.]